MTMKYNLQVNWAFHSTPDKYRYKQVPLAKLRNRDLKREHRIFLQETHPEDIIILKALFYIKVVFSPLNK